MTTRVLLVTQWFDPEPTFKGLVFARKLVALGLEVEVVTGFPNYPEGRLYEGYRLKWLQQERIDGVLVTRVPLYPSHDDSVVRRGLNFLSFASAALIYSLFGAKRPSVIYAYLPPLSVGMAAAVVGMIRRVPVVCDIQDMWPDSLRATGVVSSPRALNVVSRFCDWVYRHVDRIVVLSPGFKRLLTDRGVPEQRIDVIYNWCDEAALTGTGGTVPAGFPQSDRFRIVFAGNMGRAQALDAVLRAAQLLAERAPAIHFIMIGGGVEVERLKALAAGLGLTNVSFIPRVPAHEVGAMLREAHALLVHLRKDELFDITIPSKTQAYMAIGKPILMAVEGDAADLVTQSGCGVVAVPENPESIASAAMALSQRSDEALRAMGTLGQRYYKDHLSLQVGAEQFAKLFHELSSGTSSQIMRAPVA